MAYKWDTASGIRERLALLADLGPTLNEHHWGYHPSRDYWYSCGPESVEHPEGCTTREVQQEGSASLAMIQERWGLDRAAAMARIGHKQD